MRVLLLYFLQFVIFLDVSKCTKEWEKGHNEQGEKQNRQVKQQIQGQNKNVQRNEFYRNQAIMNQKHLLDQIQHHRTDLTTSQLNQEKQPQHNFFQNQHISQQSMKKIKLEPEDIHQQQIQHEKEKQPRITYHLDSSDEDGLEIIGDDETFAEPGQRLLNQAEQHRIDLTTNQSNQANQPQHNFFQNQHIGQQPLELKLEPENIQQQQIQQGKEKQPRIIIELDSSDDDGLEIIEENEKKAQNTYNKGKNIKEINIQNNENIQKPSSSSGININPERKRSQSKEVITFDVKPQDFKAKVQQFTSLEANQEMLRYKKIAESKGLKFDQNSYMTDPNYKDWIKILNQNDNNHMRNISSSHHQHMITLQQNQAIQNKPILPTNQYYPNMMREITFKVREELHRNSALNKSSSSNQTEHSTLEYQHPQKKAKIASDYEQTHNLTSNFQQTIPQYGQNIAQGEFALKEIENLHREQLQRRDQQEFNLLDQVQGQYLNQQNIQHPANVLTNHLHNQQHANPPQDTFEPPISEIPFETENKNEIELDLFLHGFDSSQQNLGQDIGQVQSSSIPSSSNNESNNSEDSNSRRTNL